MQAAQPLPRRRAAPLAFPRLAMLSGERYLVGAHVLTALIALSVGILLGPFQTFRRAPAFVEAWRAYVGTNYQIPVFSYYYQALTVHGVMNALVFTTFFIVGFSYFVTQRSLERPLWSVRLAWGAFVTMLAGVALVAFAIITNQANVLYTFYPSLVAHPTFYIGLVLLVVGTWMVTLNILMTYFGWRREHPGVRVPLAVYGTIVNFFVWVMATVGVAVEVLFMLLPLSLGLVKTTDPQTARALFWFFGHPLVYFWLLPAYVSLYTMLPKHAGSKILSDPIARVSFLMFLLFSVPVGAHHLFADPGVSEGIKGVHALLTFIVAVPSFLTAFNIGAMLERAGRNRGARNIVDWLWKQDWGHPVVAAHLGGLILFIAGGFSGLIHASFTLNIALHNTAWVPGHFHMTLAGMVTLTYIGVLYWLLPMIRGRALFSTKLALAQVYTWLFGMLLFGHAMGQAGINGAPRRTDLGTAAYLNAWAAEFLNESAIAGVILLVSSVLLFANVIGTLFLSRRPAAEEAPIDTAETGDQSSPFFLERWGIWLGVGMLLILVAWLPLFAESLDFINGFNVPGFRPESPVPLQLISWLGRW
jgi:cytochrome c oxidase subunit I